jgi:3-oxoacyl-[acyl-carrier protein] reductase
MELSGKTAIVTGGGTGIGKAISTLLAKNGANVVVNYSRSKAEAEATAAELRDIGVRALPVQADASNAADIANLVERAMAEFGALHMLVNNAATTKFVPMHDLENMEEEAWDRIMRINLKGPFLCCKAVAEPIRRSGGGSIVSISSVAGLRATGSSMAYAVSKAGVIHLTRCMALALAPEIRVNSVAPGFVNTRWQDVVSEERKEQIAANSPLKSHVPTENIATTVVECLRNDSMTGQTIPVEAGSLL